MPQLRIIKKYPNRRLYDTEQSHYITLADIRRLVLERIEFVVIDKKSQEDITRSILLQVISEQEQRGQPIMSRDFLSQLIRCYDGDMQGVVGSYLEQSMKLFTSQQQQIRERVKGVVGTEPAGMVADIAQQNYASWRSVQDEIFRTLSGARSRDASRQRENEKATEEEPL